jgi:hypothetical protein
VSRKRPAGWLLCKASKFAKGRLGCVKDCGQVLGLLIMQRLLLVGGR